MNTDIQVIHAQWSAPANVTAFTTLRSGGVSTDQYASLNLGVRVGDDEANVIENRKRLVRQHKLPGEPIWLNQVHGTRVVVADNAADEEADGAVTQTPNVVCAIMTADCLPIFLCNKQGTEIGLLHAGWRGLADGIVEAGLNAMQSETEDLYAWLGPAIGVGAFEVGSQVREQLCIGLVDEESVCKPSQNYGKWLADLYRLAERRLKVQGINSIATSSACTFRENDKYFSYRRDGQCGRMVSVIWINSV